MLPTSSEAAAIAAHCRRRVSTPIAMGREIIVVETRVGAGTFYKCSGPDRRETKWRAARARQDYRQVLLTLSVVATTGTEATS